MCSNYGRLSLYAFIARVHSTFYGEEALKLGLNRTHWDPDSNSAISSGDIKERKERFAQYASTKTLLEDHTKKPVSMRYGFYRVLLGTSI